MKLLPQSTTPDYASHYPVLLQEKYYSNTFSVISVVKVLSQIQFGAGSFSAGVGTSGSYFFDTLTPKASPDYAMPLVSQKGDYQFDSNGNLLTTSKPTVEQITLLIRTTLGSSSTGLGLKIPPVLSQSYKLLVQSSILKCLQPLVENGIIRDLTILAISKRGSQLAIKLTYKDSGQTIVSNLAI